MIAGELLQRELTAALQGFGLEVSEFNPGHWPEEHIARELGRSAPDGFFGINFDPRLAKIAGELAVPYAAWEIDPSANGLERVEADSASSRWTHLFCWRQSRVATLRRAGWTQVSHLPLAIDPRVRKPFSPEELTDTPAHRVLFVGSSMRDRAIELERAFIKFANQSSEFSRQPRWRALLDETKALEDALSADPCRSDLWPALEHAFEKRGLPTEALLPSGGFADLRQLVGEKLAARKRLEICRLLLDEDLAVYGGPGWEKSLPTANYVGPAGHGDQISKLMNSARINLDINRIYQPDITTLRSFEVMGCHGFLLAESHAELNQLFSEGREFVGYASRRELLEKVRYYLAHPERRAAIAAAGHEAVLSGHTVWDRVGQMMGRIAAWRWQAEKPRTHRRL